MNWTELKQQNRVTIGSEHGINEAGSLVVYWMQRSQRARDNLALEFAVEMANQLRRPLCVLFVLDPSFPGGQRRHFRFMLAGLDETAATLKQRNIPFLFQLGSLMTTPGQWFQAKRPALIVTDENFLREGQRWRQAAAESVDIAFARVDADVIVPSKQFSKEEFAARTIRPKIHRLLDEGLRRWETQEPRCQNQLDQSLWQQHEARPSRWLHACPGEEGDLPEAAFAGGTSHGLQRLNYFCEQLLPQYDAARNKPELDGTSRLSPYLHFGQLGPHTVAWAVMQSDSSPQARDVFLEELIVRRELAVNFVLHNPHYDDFRGLHPWAQKTLAEHWHDRREYLYCREQLACGQTHDPLWNAAAEQLRTEGWMHGYLRMYWAKKILEWTADPHEAFAAAAAINDAYQLDGRDPNGYTGIAWALGGKHDRAWGPQRQIFGKIRYMSLNSTGRKFNSQAYIRRYTADR